MDQVWRGVLTSIANIVTAKFTEPQGEAKLGALVHMAGTLFQLHAGPHSSRKSLAP